MSTLYVLTGGLENHQHQQDDGGSPGSWLPLPLLPVAAGHRDPPREGGEGAQGHGAVPGRPSDKSGGQEGGSSLTGNLIKCFVLYLGY